MKNNIEKRNKKTINSNNNVVRNAHLNRAKVMVVLAFFIAIMVYLILIVYKFVINPNNEVVVKEGKISKEETVNGYIVRDETVIKGENYKNGMVKIKSTAEKYQGTIKSEGEKVANGDPIFRYYSSGEENLKKKISELDVKIQEAMNQNNEDLFSSDTKLLDTQIEQRLSEIDGINSMQKITEYKKEISESITKKAKIAGELSPSGSYLKKLIDERSGYERQLNSGAEYIKASKSGIVSYRIDGLEETLNGNDFSKMNKDFLEELNIKTGQIISSSNEAGKVVDNFNCYIACTSKSEEANSAKIGDRVIIALPSSKEVNAKIEYITKESDNEVTMVFSITEGIDELLTYRKTTIDIIWWYAEGFKVPNSSIITENNLDYVIRTRAGYLDKVLIKVKKKTDSYSIVANYSTSEIEQLHIKQGISTSITLYDELILNPTKEQINKNE